MTTVEGRPPCRSCGSPVEGDVPQWPSGNAECLECQQNGAGA